MQRLAMMARGRLISARMRVAQGQPMPGLSKRACKVKGKTIPPSEPPTQAIPVNVPRLQ